MAKDTGAEVEIGSPMGGPKQLHKENFFSATAVFLQNVMGSKSCFPLNHMSVLKVNIQENTG